MDGKDIKKKQIRFINEREYYIRIEIMDTIEYHCFGEDYDSAKTYCINNNIKLTHNIIYNYNAFKD